MSDRSFNFPVSVLVRDAQLLLGALREEIGEPVLKRLPAGFDAGLEAQIKLVGAGSNEQKGAAGNTGGLTKAQNAALAEVRRLTGGARETAKLAFAADPVRLRQEFLVGSSEPSGLASTLAQARTLQAAAVKYATALAEKGWTGDDTTVLAATIAQLEGADATQEASKGDHKAATAAKNKSADVLYDQAKAVQNAADLAYPKAKASTDATVVEARSLFLLDSFPPANAVKGKKSDGPAEPGKAAKTSPALTAAK